MGSQVYTKFQRNRPIRYRDTAGGTLVTSTQVARATISGSEWPIVLKFDVWLETQKLRDLQESEVE